MVPRSIVGAMLLVVCTAVLPAAALAHGLPPVPLALWGPFGRPTVNCMRRLNHAAQQCFHAVYAAHRRCMDARLAGATCNTSQRDAAIQAAIGAAQATVEQVCFGGQLTELRFASFDDARTDIARACNEAATAADMVYAPAAAPASVEDMEMEHRRCMAHTGAMSSKLVSLMMRDKSRVLDQIGLRIMPPSQKLGMLAHAGQRIDAARQQLNSRMDEICPEFRGPYVVDSATFLSALERRSDCLLGMMYYQTSIVCSPSSCGDAIKEPGEECDDGNQIETDACHNNCTRR